MPPAPQAASPLRSRVRRRGARWAPLAALLLVLLGGRADLGAAPTPPAPPGWSWEVGVDGDLTRLTVRMCFRGFRPRRLSLPHADARTTIVLPDGAREPRLERAGDGFEVVDTRGDAFACVEYAVDVDALVRAGVAERVGGDLLTQPGAWLLVPARFTPQEEARVRWRLPPGVNVSAPWASDGDGGWRVPDTAFLFESRVAFGRFVARRLEVAGAAFDVAVLDAPHAASDPGIDRWLLEAGRCVAQLYAGRFPAERVQVLVHPVRPSSEPVVFGRAMQAGGAAILLYLAASARDADLPLEWIAVHELTHLGMPWIVSEDAWLSEGFVTWYQETLRGRAGYFGAEGAWRALEEGFARGRRRASDRPLSEESRLMHQRHAYHRVYWGGAALAMRIDLALRAETQGRRSLDDVMRVWTSPQVRARRGWRGIELLAEADRLLGTRAASAAVAETLAAREFPDTDALFAALGIGRDASGARTFSTDPGMRDVRRLIGGGDR